MCDPHEGGFGLAYYVRTGEPGCLSCSLGNRQPSVNFLFNHSSGQRGIEISDFAVQAQSVNAQHKFEPTIIAERDPLRVDVSSCLQALRGPFDRGTAGSQETPSFPGSSSQFTVSP